jgi:transcriptional regulator with XRE-family HTH domain
MTIPETIRAARERAGMTQLEVGQALGYKGNAAQVYVATWEAGTRPVPKAKINALAELLNLDPMRLL